MGMEGEEFVVPLESEESLKELKRKVEGIFPSVTLEALPGDQESPLQWIRLTHPSRKSFVRKARELVLIWRQDPECVSDTSLSRNAQEILTMDNGIWLRLLQIKMAVVAELCDEEKLKVSGKSERVVEALEEIFELESALQAEKKNFPEVRRDFLLCVTKSECAISWDKYAAFPCSVLRILTRLFNGADDEEMVEAIGTGQENTAGNPELVVSDVTPEPTASINNAESGIPMETVTAKESRPSTSAGDLFILDRNPAHVSIDNDESSFPLERMSVAEHSASTSTAVDSRGSEYAGERRGDYLLRPVVIDACNVGFSHAKDTALSVKGVILALKHFIELGHKTEAVMPENFSLRHPNPRRDKKILDQHLLDELEKEHLLTYSTSRSIVDSSGRMMTATNYDDLVILRRARNTGGVVVSRDRFRDVSLSKPDLRPIINERVLSPIWFQDDIQFADDGPLAKRGKSLEDTLRADLRLGEEALACFEYQLTKKEQEKQIRTLSRILASCTNTVHNSSDFTASRKREREPSAAGESNKKNSSEDMTPQFVAMGFSPQQVRRAIQIHPTSENDILDYLQALNSG